MNRDLFARPRPPHGTMMLFERMSVASRALHHLMNMARRPAFAVARRCAAYLRDRLTGWPRGTRLANGGAIVAALARAVGKAGQEIRLGVARSGPWPHFSDRAKPGVICVGPDRLRFANEASVYHDFVPALIDASGHHPEGVHGPDRDGSHSLAALRVGAGGAVSGAAAGLTFGAEMTSGYIAAINAAMSDTRITR